MLTDDIRAPRSFQIVVPSDKNMRGANRPSAWTIQHTMLVVGTLAVIAGVALLWVLLLRRKVAEQTAIWQQSEAKFRSLVEQSLVGVYVLQDGRFVYANPRMANIFGYSIEEFTAGKLDHPGHRFTRRTGRRSKHRSTAAWPANSPAPITLSRAAARTAS